MHLINLIHAFFRHIFSPDLNLVGYLAANRERGWSEIIKPKQKFNSKKRKKKYFTVP